MFGLEAIFRVCLSLLALHKQQLLACHSFEQLISYLKEELIKTEPSQLQSLFSLAAALDITRQLLVYEIEYQVIQEEMQYRPLLQATTSNSLPGTIITNAASSLSTNLSNTNSKQRKISASVAVGTDSELSDFVSGDSPLSERIRQLEKENKTLKHRNMEILDQLHVAQSSVYSLESSLDSYKSSIRRLETRVRALEDERDALLHMVAK